MSLETLLVDYIIQFGRDYAISIHHIHINGYDALIDIQFHYPIAAQEQVEQLQIKLQEILPDLTVFFTLDAESPAEIVVCRC